MTNEASKNSETSRFMTFVINLDSDTERMAFMDSQLKTLGIPYERQVALRGNAPECVQDYSVTDAIRIGGHELLSGELGCAASHKRVYQKIIEQNLSYALVLEDDVELPLAFKAIIEREIKRNRSNWEYLSFDYWQPGIPFIKRWFASLLVNLENAKKKGLLAAVRFSTYSAMKAFYIIPLSLFEGWRNSHKRMKPGPVQFLRPMYLAGAYVVTYTGAQKLLALASPIVYTADKLPNQTRVKKGLKFYAYAPLSVWQRKEEFGSSILGLPGNKL